MKDSLSETLNFLTVDNFDFRFSKNHTPTPFSGFLGYGSADPEGIQRIVLFSGGLDSLTGAVPEFCTITGKWPWFTTDRSRI